MCRMSCQIAYNGHGSGRGGRGDTVPFAFTLLFLVACSVAYVFLVLFSIMILLPVVE